MTQDQPESVKPVRSRGRKNVVASSPHREDYDRLMRAGWSSLALERYAAYRYGEDIPASTFRAYKSRKKVSAQVSPPKKWEGVEGDVAVDVLETRAQLIDLQRQRIAIDWEHEKSMKKLFGSTRGEIEVLSRLLSEHKADLQDVGIMPKAGEKIEVTNRNAGPTAEEAPRAQSLADLIGASPESEMALARVLHMSANGKKNGKTA